MGFWGFKSTAGKGGFLYSNKQKFIIGRNNACDGRCRSEKIKFPFGITTMSIIIFVI